MKFVTVFTISIILYLLTARVPAQSIVTFDDQNWTSDQILPSQFSVDNFSFSSSEPFYTNYGYNFDVNGISLYYVFQNTASDKIIIAANNGEPVNLISLDAYQVSETSTDSLVIEGWNNNEMVYTHAFLNVSAWETLKLNYNNINKIVIRLDSVSSGGLTDYNFDNFSFQNAVSSVSNASAGIPKSYGLNQNYPNPFNPSTVISYRIAKSGKVVLKIYDLLGREVTTLVDKNEAAGSYAVTFNAGSLSSGLYIYVLKAGNFVSTRKMILLK